MIIRDWLRQCTPPAPPALSARVLEALGARAEASIDVAPDAFVGAATEMLVPLLQREGAGREGALDLLTADALMTYAFETAASDPDRLDERARAAMAWLAALAPAKTAADERMEASAARVDARE